MAEVPSIGDSLTVDEVEFKRIFCGIIADGTIAQHSKYPYLSSALGFQNTSGAKIIRTRDTGMPKVMIESQKHEREVMARNDLVKD